MTRQRPFEGESVRRLTDFGYNPTWSPDGQRIAFWGLRDFGGGGSQREIGVIDAEGRESSWVTDDPAVDWSPVWSPDGGSLTYISDRGGSANIWRIHLDRESGEAVGPPRPLTAPSQLVSRIAISGDGKQLAFTDENVSSNVARVALDAATGAGSPESVTRGSREFVQAQASPDGEWVAFRSAGGQEDLFVVRADGSGLLQLTDDSAKDRQPNWSADGQRLLFYSDRSGRYEFWTMNRDGSGLEQLTEGEGDSFFYPKWSPDEAKIVATHSEASAIWDLSSTQLASEYERLPPIGDEGRYLFDPVWSPDGSRLAGLSLEANQSPSQNDGLAIYTLETGVYDFVYEPEVDQAILGVVWASDGERVFLELREAGGSHVLATLELESGALEKLWTAPEGASDLRPSTDGETVYFIQGGEETDLWLATFE